MRGTPARFVDFRGGVNTNAAAYLVANNECRDCRNVVSTTRGSIKKRNGNTTFSANFLGGTGVTSLFALEQGVPFLVASTGAAIHAIDTGGLAQPISTAVTLTAGTRWEFVQAPVKAGQGPLYGMNGVDTPKQWVGTTSTMVADWTATVGAIPNGRYCVYFHNRVFVTGVDLNPQTLYFSNPGEPREFPTDNFVTFEPQDGQPITGLGTCGPYLLVFKRNKTYVVYDPDSGANRPISSSVGCPSHRSIVESSKGTFFLSDDGEIYQTNGTSLKLISTNIGATLNNIVAAQRPNAAGAYWDDHYYLSICTAGTANNLTLDYDVQTESWWIHSNAAHQFAVWRPGSTAATVLHAASVTKYIDACYVAGVNQDNGANYTAYWRGPWIAFNEPYRHKRIRRLHLDGSGVVDVYVGVDFSGDESLFGSGVFPLSLGMIFGVDGSFGGDGIFGSVGSQSEAVLYSLGVGRAFSVRLQSTSSSAMEVDAMTFNYTPRQN